MENSFAKANSPAGRGTPIPPHRTGYDCYLFSDLKRNSAYKEDYFIRTGHQRE